jgi:transmembrane sensor
VRRHIGKRYAPEVYERACEWFVEFRTDPADEPLRQAFYAWLQQAPAHMAAYLDVASSWNWMGTLDVRARFPKEVLIAQAGGSDNLLALPRSAARRQPAPPRGTGSWLRRPIALAAAASAILVLAAVLVTAWMRSSPVYSTGIGQKRLITLPDGSVIHLNASSRVLVRYSKTRREIDLIRGQALFVDTYEPGRPFIVRSPATVVRAIGTQFDVNLLDAETIVTVIQGQVSVAPKRAAVPPASGLLQPLSYHASPELPTVYLTAGEQVTVTPARHLQPVRANVRDAIAWTHHQLIFASTALRDVVQEFNRYNDRPLVIASPSLETFKIDGVFSSTDPKSLIAFLQQYPGIKVTETDGDVVISRQ